MLAGFRQSTDNADPRLRATGGDRTWFDRLADVADRQAQERQARERREEEDRREQERLRLQAEQRMAEQARQEQATREKFRADNADRFGDNADAAYDTLNNGRGAISQWAQTPDGYRFLSSGGADKVDYVKLSGNPYSILAQNKNLREFDYGLSDPAELTKRGIPEDIVKALHTYLYSKDGEKDYGGKAGVRAGDPIADTVTSLTGSKLAGSLASGISLGIPVVGAANAGASGGNTDLSDRRLWGEMANVGVGAALGATAKVPKPGVAGATERIGIQSVADRAASAALKGVLPESAARVVGRVGAGAAINAAQTGAIQATYGEFNPADIGISAAAGGGISGAVALHPALRSVIKEVPPEFKTAAVTYATARGLGADDEEARNYALMAAGATAIGRRGFKEALASGFGMGDVMNRLQHAAPEAQITDLPTGTGIVYHGKAGPLSGPLDADSFVTTSLADAQTFARGSSRLTGESPMVYAFEANPAALRPSGVEGLAAARGAMQVADPAGLRPVGASGVPQRPAFGLSTENTDLGPSTSLVPETETGLAPRAQTDLAPAGGRNLAPVADGGGASPPIEPLGQAALPYGDPNFPRKPGPRNVVPEPPKPTDDGIPYMEPGRGDEFIRQADQQLDSHLGTDKVKAALDAVRGDGNKYRAALADVLGIPVKVIEAIDPGSKFARPVLRSMLAAGNFMNSQHMEMTARLRQVKSDMNPLIGEALGRKLEREAIRLAPAVAGTTAGAVVGLDTEEGRRLAALGVTASYILHTGDAFVPKDAPFMHVKYAIGDGGLLPKSGVAPDDLPAGLRTPQGRLAHMVVYPEDFQLTPEQAAAAKAGQKTLAAGFEAQQKFQAWASRKVTADLQDQEGNRLFQWFTPESVEKALNDKNYFPGKTGLPGFASELPIEQRRDLGPNVVDAMLKHPDLKLDGDVLSLFTRDLDQKNRVMANAIVVKALTAGEEGKDGFVKDRTTDAGDAMRDAINIRDGLERGSAPWLEADTQVGRLKKVLDEGRAAEAKLGLRTGWQEIPGVSGYKFAPEVLESVKKLAVERPGEFGSLLDSVTSNIRTLMFTADLSAWTMQGYMTAIRNPGAAIRVAPQVLAASIFGDAYTGRWVKQNYELVRKWSARGLVNGREVDELANGAQVARAPGIHQVESRGFQNALPVMRILMAEQMSRAEALPSMITETGRFQKALGAIGMNDAARLAQFGATYLPAAAGAYVAADEDKPMWERVMAAALGAGGTMAMRGLLSTAGKSYLERMPQAQRDALETRVAKDINRVSGVMNKPQMGITKTQGQIERTFLFRSPALLRNTLILTKLALTNTGPEGAMARLYLLQTGIMLAATGVGIKLATGQGMDSLDPTDEKSVLHPRTFGRIDEGAAGNFTPSNPVASLVRAVFYHQAAEGEPRGGFGSPNPKDAAAGLLGYGEARLTDVVGQLYKPGIDQLREGMTGQPSPFESPIQATLESISKGDALGALGNSLGRMAVPLPAQAAAEAGLIPLPGLRTDPSYNSSQEKMAGPLLNMLGMSYNPETRSQESVRRTAVAVSEQFPEATDANQNGIIDRRDLNDMQREQFDASQAGAELKSFGEETRSMRADQPDSQVDKYFAARAADTDSHVQRLKDIETAVADGSMSKFEFRTAYQEEQKRFVEIKKQTDTLYEKQMVGRPVWDKDAQKGRDMNVVEYVKRNPSTEDGNVDKWFSLYDQATGVNGKLDFDKLDALQADFRKSLPDDERTYLDERLASFKDKGVTDSKGVVADLPTLRELSGIKEAAAASGFWKVADDLFPALQAESPELSSFKNYSEFSQYVDEIAQESGVDRGTVMSQLERLVPGLKLFNMEVTQTQRTMRGKNLKLDLGLEDFYQRDAVNYEAAIARRYGDHSYDDAPLESLQLLKPATAKQRQGFSWRYGAKPISSYFQSN